MPILEGLVGSASSETSFSDTRLSRIIEAPYRWADGSSDAPRSLTIHKEDDILVTSAFLPISLKKRILYEDLSYIALKDWFKLRPAIADGRFSLEPDIATVVKEPCFLIGGSFDLVWYHWISNWLPRLLLARELEPRAFFDPGVKFLVHYTMEAPKFDWFFEFLGVERSRLVYAHLDRETLLEHALMPSFFPQDTYSRWALRSCSSLYGSTAGDVTPHRRIWVSRQAIPSPARKILNFDEIEPVLAKHEIEIVDFAEMTTPQQIATAREATLMVGIHGAGLVNFAFCAPRTSLLLLDAQSSIDCGLSGMFTALPALLEGRSKVIPVERALLEGVDYGNFVNLHRADVVADPAALDAALSELSST